jgi:hypothetical protein
MKEEFKNEDGNDIVENLSSIIEAYEELAQIIEKLKWM